MSDTVDANSPNKTPGTQTLARGLEALRLVATTPGGLTIQEVAGALGVHRTIASRLLSTVADFRLLARGPDGRYRAGGGIAALSRELYSGLREASMPTLRKLANDLGGTIAIFVGEEEDAVAVAVVEPVDAHYWVSFRQGGRHPIGQGAAGYALLSTRPERVGEPEGAARARADGYVISCGEVEPGYWGLAVPLERPVDEPPACVVLISAAQELVRRVVPEMREAAAQLSRYAG